MDVHIAWLWKIGNFESCVSGSDWWSYIYTRATLFFHNCRLQTPTKIIELYTHVDSSATLHSRHPQPHSYPDQANITNQHRILSAE